MFLLSSIDDHWKQLLSFEQSDCRQRCQCTQKAARPRGYEANYVQVTWERLSHPNAAHRIILRTVSLLLTRIRSIHSSTISSDKQQYHYYPYLLISNTPCFKKKSLSLREPMLHSQPTHQIAQSFKPLAWNKDDQKHTKTNRCVPEHG